MNIAIVGGGTRCSRLLDFFNKYSFEKLHPKIVAIVDEREDAPCIPKAKANGVFVSDDYNDLFDRDDIDLIVEMTGNEEVFYDILRKKKREVRAFDHRTAQLFWEVSHVSEMQEETARELDKAKTAFGVIMNELIQEDVMIIGADYKIIDANVTLLKKAGLSRDAIIGRHCYEISHHQAAPCEGEHHPCPLRDALKTGKPSLATHMHLDRDGKESFHSISCYPIYENGKVVAVVELSKDITKDITIQKTMMQQEKLASIGRLAAGVAHEINNPMTTILTTAMLMQEEMETEDPTYIELQTISDETLRCRKIVSSLLDFARQSNPVKKFQDINDIILESITLTRKQAAFQDVQIKTNFSTELSLINVDRDQIQQALINLALNAIEAIEGGGEITFTTRPSSGKNAVDILVSDNGKGISKENMPRVFEPFFTTKETGTGLGMSVTYGLIQQHGGLISVESEIGRGTTFTITLPVNGDGKGMHAN